MLLCIVTVIAVASGAAARETQRVDISGTYRGTIESPTKMSGTVDVSGALSGSTTWTATKK
ncbi:MAG TPA: hypothetical protein VH436_04645 [Vicinamibacterales bacterium]|jgi:hypothetical protein